MEEERQSRSSGTPQRPEAFRSGKLFSIGYDPLTDVFTEEQKLGVAWNMAEQLRAWRAEDSRMVVMKDHTDGSVLKGRLPSFTPGATKQAELRQKLRIIMRGPSFAVRDQHHRDFIWDVLDPWKDHDENASFPLTEDDFITKAAGVRLPERRVYVAQRRIALVEAGARRPLRWYLDPMSSVHRTLLRWAEDHGQAEAAERALRWNQGARG